MMQPAMSFSKGRKFALLLALTVPASIAAQVMPEPDATEVAKTPLRDLNIDGRDIPEALKVAVENPYETRRLKTWTVKGWSSSSSITCRACSKRCTLIPGSSGFASVQGTVKF